MKPPMKNIAIVIFTDMSGTPDRYGKYPTITIETPARVNISTKILKNSDGTERRASLEIDLPPDVNLEYGTKIKALDNFMVWHEAEIIDIDDATNFAGNRVFYRTVLCG